MVIICFLYKTHTNEARQIDAAHYDLGTRHPNQETLYSLHNEQVSYSNPEVVGVVLIFFYIIYPQITITIKLKFYREPLLHTCRKMTDIQNIFQITIVQQLSL